MADNIITTNSKAYRDYHILETLEAGIQLKGSEVKSLREKRASLNESYARLENGNITLYGCHITNYEKKDGFDKLEPTRPRRLLLHRKEINKLAGKVVQRGFSLIATKMYFSRRGLAKVELALAKGKKLFDKRRAIKERELKRQLGRTIRRRS